MNIKRGDWFLVEYSKIWRKCSNVNKDIVKYNYYYDGEISLSKSYEAFRIEEIIRVLTEEEFQMEFL